MGVWTGFYTQVLDATERSFWQFPGPAVIITGIMREAKN
jgi:hypothetical protein